MAKKRNGKYKHLHLDIFIGAVGIVLFWRGIWALADYAPILENAWVSLAIGIILMYISHQLYKEL